MPIRKVDGIDEFYSTKPYTLGVLYSFGDTSILFRAVAPKVWSAVPVQEALMEMLTDIGRIGVGLYKRTVVGWTFSPDFRSGDLSTKDGTLSALISGSGATPVEGKDATAEQIYDFVDRGTQPHTIDAKAPSISEVPTSFGTVLIGGGQPMLVFQSDYFPSTSPGDLQSGQNSYGGQWIRTPSVDHPGVAPRGFSEQIGELLTAEMRRQAPRALRKGVANIIKRGFRGK